MTRLHHIIIAVLLLFSAVLGYRFGLKPNIRGLLLSRKIMREISSKLPMSDDSDASAQEMKETLPPKGTSPKNCPFHPGCGCDGTGKMQGGIATYPYFGWWPIKVYRPCPEYVAGGYIYKREGQTMDQVLFSEPSTKMQETLKQRRLDEIKALEAEKEKVSLLREAEEMAAAGEKVAEERMKIADEVDELLEKRFGGEEK